jgi:uracil-DNA glycosylase family 4
MDSLAKLQKEIERCPRCPRLRKYCAEIAAAKKREFKEWSYWGKPVTGFGDPRARLWILGLAPAAHGANRTGRMFTGDSSGKWLYRALYQTGFASQETSESRTDGLRLRDAYISSSARCAPPDNKPLPEELKNCASYLDREFALLGRVTIFLALGNIGYQAILNLLARQGLAFPRPRPEFGHNRVYPIGPYQILTSYHPSRQNTQTGKLTEGMWLDIFERARTMLKKSSRA